LQQCYLEKTIRFNNYVLWFPKEAKERLGNLLSTSMELTIYNIVFLTILYY
jgi:hypothetical protein